jgi:4a-hydroxytetrahydrobiopterin dehydratase
MEKLNDSQLNESLTNLSQWTLNGGKLVRTWTFKDFVAAMAFVNRVAEQAEAAGHHPDIDIRYNRVQLGLATHDAGGITAKDIEMAVLLDTN